jgi:hypothetical protein
MNLIAGVPWSTMRGPAVEELRGKASHIKGGNSTSGTNFRQ